MAAFFGDIPGLIAYVKAGRLKAIGIAAPKRHPALPEVPTLAEQGLPGVDSNNWYALFAPAKTPPDYDRCAQPGGAQRARRTGGEPEACRRAAPYPPRRRRRSSPCCCARDTEKWASSSREEDHRRVIGPRTDIDQGRSRHEPRRFAFRRCEPGTRPELAEIERTIEAERGDISVLYQVLLHSAPIAAGWEKLLTAVRNRTSVPAALRELVILRVAVLNRATFEFDAHVPHAIRAGVTQTKIASVRDWRGGAHRVGAATGRRGVGLRRRRGARAGAGGRDDPRHRGPRRV